MVAKEIEKCSRIIAEKKLKIAFVESATAGWLASEFALSPMSGKILQGGLVCYDLSTKERLFNISSSIFKKHTAESKKVTQLLAEGLPTYFKADIFVAITGLITFGGSETPQKPVGTMFIGFLINDRYFGHKKHFSGNPKQVISKTIVTTCKLLTEHLLE